jgi:hypothetical protein
MNARATLLNGRAVKENDGLTVAYILPLCRYPVWILAGILAEFFVVFLSLYRLMLG